MIKAFQYDVNSKKLSEVGWAHKAETYFKMMGWVIPSQISEVDKSGKLYYCLHLPFGTYHWTEEGLLGELREKGVIS